MAQPAQRRPVQERSQVTRERLLAAALKSFSSVGYAASSTRQIETAAGIRRGLVSYHFGTKEALWKATAAWMFEGATREMHDAERGTTNVEPLARIRHFIRAYVRFCARHPEVNRLLLRAGMNNDWRLNWLVENVVRPWYARIRRIHEQARWSGPTPQIEPLHFYYILTGAAALIYSMAPEAQRITGIDPRQESVVDTHADALADLLFPAQSEQH